MDKLRLRFQKTGRAIYISHLDLMQTMQRAFSRAGYELKYSEGFNPHPQISIALPLSVGTASLCELMDFRLKTEPELSQLPARLSAALPEGIKVLDCYEPQRKVSQLKYLSISGRFEYDGRSPASLLEPLQAFYAAPEIIISKKTKRGQGEMDIKPAIRRLSFAPGEEGLTLSAVISAQEPTLNPELLADALRQKAPALAPDFACFTRIETYDASMQLYR